jgi:hypothetical protein
VSGNLKGMIEQVGTFGCMDCFNLNAFCLFQAISEFMNSSNELIDATSGWYYDQLFMVCPLGAGRVLILHRVIMTHHINNNCPL